MGYKDMSCGSRVGAGLLLSIQDNIRSVGERYWEYVACIISCCERAVYLFLALG